MNLITYEDSSIAPHWIPNFVQQKINEKFPDYEDRIYEIFENDFIVSQPTYHGLPVRARRYKEETDGKWSGFIHITSVEDSFSKERVVDIDRCKRIRFPKAVIENYYDCDICHYSVCEKPLVWTSLARNNRVRVQILIPSEQYIVILEPNEEKGYCLLVTAYKITYERRMETIMKYYYEACKAGRALQ